AGRRGCRRRPARAPAAAAPLQPPRSRGHSRRRPAVLHRPPERSGDSARASAPPGGAARLPDGGGNGYRAQSVSGTAGRGGGCTGWDFTGSLRPTTWSSTAIMERERSRLGFSRGEVEGSQATAPLFPPAGKSGVRVQANLAQLATAPAVARILQLQEDAVRVGEVQLRRAALGAAAFRHAQADVVHERAGLASV